MGERRGLDDGDMGGLEDGECGRERRVRGGLRGWGIWEGREGERMG